MELKTPRTKIRQKKENDNESYFPICKNNRKFIGYFNGFNVVVSSPEDVKTLLRNGAFGKQEFSRTSLNQPTEILRERQYEGRYKYPPGTTKKVLVVPDSDDENNERYFKDLKPKFAIDKSAFPNPLILSLYEAYFLSDMVECLKIENITNIWRDFNESDSNFVTNYAVYLHFRTKNWVVKSGVKFGGDFLLYKRGPEYFHASYVVIIDVINDDLNRIYTKTRRSMDYMNLVGLNRLCETTGKELLIVQVVYPEVIEIESSEDLRKLSINEILFRRFILTQNT